MANGYVPTVTWSSAPVWFVLWMLLIPMWSGLHFYWVHRLEHHPKLYKHVHAVHHRNVNIGPWSGISNHWYENILYFTTYFIHLIIPSHPLHTSVPYLFPSRSARSFPIPVSKSCGRKRPMLPALAISSISCTTAISSATTAPRKSRSTSGSAPITTVRPRRRRARGRSRNRCTPNVFGQRPDQVLSNRAT